MSDQPVVIRAVDLRRVYGEGEQQVHALRGATLSVSAGEIVAVSGPSGSGKTTLLNCLVGLDSPTDGQLTVLGQDLADLAYEDRVGWRREHMAIVFQATGLLPHLSAAENVDVVLRIRGVGRVERKRRVDEALDQLGIGALHSHRPGELSGGQQQRVSLARALASRPSLLVADEPTGQLDSDTSAMVLEQLRQAASEHVLTIVMSTHDRAAEASADRVLHLVDGAIDHEQAQDGNEV